MLIDKTMDIRTLAILGTKWKLVEKWEIPLFYNACGLFITHGDSLVFDFLSKYPYVISNNYYYMSNSKIADTFFVEQEKYDAIVLKVGKVET
jgi:hypothetical protein